MPAISLASSMDKGLKLISTSKNGEDEKQAYEIQHKDVGENLSQLVSSLALDFDSGATYCVGVHWPVVHAL